MKLYRKTFRLRMSMKDGIDIQGPANAAVSHALTYAIVVLSSAFSAWLVITAIRWW